MLNLNKNKNKIINVNSGYLNFKNTLGKGNKIRDKREMFVVFKV